MPERLGHIDVTSTDGSKFRLCKSRQFETNRFAIAANQQSVPSDDWLVPSPFVQGIERCDFHEFVWIRFDQRDSAEFRLDQQRLIHKNQLAVAITSALPAASPIHE